MGGSIPSDPFFEIVVYGHMASLMRTIGADRGGSIPPDLFNMRYL